MAAYEDKFCSIDNEGVVVIKWFYFPFGTSKTIRREQIKDIKMVGTNGVFGTKFWGMALDNVWWACGNKGCTEPKKLIIITTDSCIKKGFACENGQAFMDAYAHSAQNQEVPLVANPVLSK